MGFIRVKVVVGAPSLQKVREEVFLADSGSWYMILTPKLADKRVIEAPVTPAYIKVLDREAILMAAILDTPEPLLGVSTMEALGLELDPITREVKATKPALLLV